MTGRILVLICLLCVTTFARPPQDDRLAEIGNIADQPVLLIDNLQYLDANSILMFITNHGSFGRDLADSFGYDYGTFYPYQTVADIESGLLTASPLYAAGPWIGGLVNGEIRVAISEYSDEFVPGPMENGTYLPDQPAFQVYKLYRDSLESNPNADYLQWPVDQGAPVDGAGKPRMKGDQMIWTVFNDADPYQHNNNAGETDPLGIEVQFCTWAYDSESDETTYVSSTETADHVGPSSGAVEVTSVDPAALTGDQYRVVFTELGSGAYLWDLINVTTGQTLLVDQTDEFGPVVEGFKVHVLLSEDRVVSIDEIANAGGLLDPVESVMFSLNSSGDWYVTSDAGNNFSRLNWRGLMGTADWEFRFTESGSEYYNWNTDGLFAGRAPFEVWNIGEGTPDDPSDDVRLFYSILDDDDDGGWSWGDRIYVIEQPYVEPAPTSLNYTWPDDFRIGRIVYRDMSGILTHPDPGTIVRFTTSKVPGYTAADTFSFTPPTPIAVATGGEGNCIYSEYTLTNKGGNSIDDCYLGLWTDPDVGTSTDDMVGCDPENNVFYAYNGSPTDDHYGGLPPAIGFKILEAPVLPTAGSVAYVDGKPIPNYRSTQMSAFTKYINGTDPGNWEETYCYMQGLAKGCIPYYDPTTGMPTTYMHAGDPVTGIGDLDPIPSDKRMMASFGPFTFSPGEVQRVAFKMAVGQGPDRLASITKVRELLEFDPGAPLNASVAITPDPVKPLARDTVRIYVGDLDDGYTANDIVPATLTINGVDIPSQTAVLSSYPGFTGPVMEITMTVAMFLNSYAYETGEPVQPYGVAFETTDEQAFVGTGNVTLVVINIGDVNGDEEVNISDLTYLIGTLFLNGPDPVSIEAANLNCDEAGSVDISDLTKLVNHLFVTFEELHACQ